MISQCLAAGLVLNVGLLIGPVGNGAQSQRAVPEQPKAVPTANVQRQLANLEKQLMALTEELAALRIESRAKAVAATAVAKTQVRFYSLREANAAEVAKTLQQLFQDDVGRRYRIALHESSNSLVIRATAEDLDEIDAIINRLETATSESKKIKPADKKPKEQDSRRLDEIKQQLAVAESDVEMSKERLAWSERMLKKGYISDVQIKAEKNRLASAEVVLEKARNELKELTSGLKKSTGEERKPRK